MSQLIYKERIDIAPAGAKVDRNSSVSSYRASEDIEFGLGVVLSKDKDVRLPIASAAIITFDIDFVASNEINMDINGESIEPVIFNESHNQTLLDLITEINKIEGAEARVSGERGFTIIVKDTVASVENVIVTGGATQASADIAASSGDIFLGVSLRDSSISQGLVGGSFYKQNTEASVMTNGKIYVFVETDVEAGGPVYLRHTAGDAGELPGQFRNDDDENKAYLIEGISFFESAKAGEIAIIDLNIKSSKKTIEAAEEKGDDGGDIDPIDPVDPVQPGVFISEGAFVRKLDFNGDEIWNYEHTGDFIYQLSVDNNGNSYAATNAGHVVKLNAEGSEVWTNTNHSSAATIAIVDPDGFVYSASNDKTVRKIDSDGEQVWSFSVSTNPNGLAVDSDGFVYCGGSGLIQKITPEGSASLTFTGFSGNVLSVALDSDDNVYGGGNDKSVRKFNSSGTQSWNFPGNTGHVRAIAVDSDGFVYCGDDKIVRKIDSDGEQVWSYTGNTGSIQAVAVDPDGFVYSAGGTDKTIHKIDSNGDGVWVETMANGTFGVDVSPGKHPNFS